MATTTVGVDLYHLEEIDSFATESFLVPLTARNVPQTHRRFD